MATSDIEIANEALLLLGENAITSFTDNTKAARVLNQLYTRSRDNLIARYNWNFSVKRASLAQVSTAPEFEFDNAYQIPTDCLRVLSTDFQNYTSTYAQFYPSGNTLYRVEGDKLLCNEGTCKIKYVARIEDPNVFSQLFIDTFAAYLAMKSAIPITDSNTRKKDATDAFNKLEAVCPSIDSQQGTPEEVDQGSFLNVRY